MALTYVILIFSSLTLFLTEGFIIALEKIYTQKLNDNKKFFLKIISSSIFLGFIIFSSLFLAKFSDSLGLRKEMRMLSLIIMINAGTYICLNGKRYKRVI